MKHKPSPDLPTDLPTEGGSYVRDKSGKLVRESKPAAKPKAPILPAKE